MLCHPWFLEMISGWLFGCPVPRHQFIDAVLRPAVHQACQQVSEVSLRIGAIEFAGLDQRCQARPVFSTFVTAREQTIFLDNETGRIARSILLLSISIRPSSRNRPNPSQWFNA